VYVVEAPFALAEHHGRRRVGVGSKALESHHPIGRRLFESVKRRMRWFERVKRAKNAD